MKTKLHVIGFGLAFTIVGFVLGHQTSELNQTCPVLCDQYCPPCAIQEPLEPLIEFLPCPNPPKTESIDCFAQGFISVEEGEDMYNEGYNDGEELGFIHGEKQGRFNCNAEWQQYN